MGIPVGLSVAAIVANVAGTTASAVSSAKNRKSQEEQNAIDRRRQDTAISRAVQQQRSVGINPVTSDGSTPQLQADSMPAPQFDSSGITNSLNQFSSLSGSLYQSDMQREVNEQNQALSFLQTQQSNAQTDTQHLEELIERADNDFKTLIVSTDKETQEFFTQVENNRKDFDNKDKIVADNTELKTLLETLDKDNTLWKVDSGVLYIDTDRLKKEFGKSFFFKNRKCV